MSANYHICEPRRRAGGNQYYRDKTLVPLRNLCGAERTMKDIGYYDPAHSWSDGREQYTPCPDCLSRRQSLVIA